MGIVSASPPLFTVASFLNLLKDLYLVESSLHVVRGALLNFDCDIGIILKIFAQPNSGEVAPA